MQRDFWFESIRLISKTNAVTPVFHIIFRKEKAIEALEPEAETGECMDSDLTQRRVFIY
jgi:hypothetical protein